MAFGGTQTQAMPVQAAGAGNPLDNPQAYDSEMMYMFKKINDKAHPQGWGEWLMGKPVSVPPAELRDEKYAAYIVCMEKTFEVWEKKELSSAQTLQKVEFYMGQLKQIGRVDGDRARMLLYHEGIDDQRRMDLEREYQDLRRQCGQAIPQYSKTAAGKTAAGHNKSSGFFNCCASPSHEDAHKTATSTMATGQPMATQSYSPFQTYPPHH